MGSMLTKVFGWLKGFLKSMPSPLSGYDIADVKVNTKDGKYSALFTFDGEQKLTDERNEGELTDIKGNAIKYNVLISAINVNEALAPLLSGMNKMDKADQTVNNSADASVDLLNILLGKDRQDNQLQEKSGKGLLGLDPKDYDKFFYTDCGSYEGKTWSWGEIAGDYLKYSLECQAEDKDVGTIENQKLTTCQNLISEYLVRTDIISNIDEVKVDILKLCLPILATIQGKLCEYYQDAYNKQVEGKSTAEKEAEAKEQEQNDESQGDQQQGDQQQDNQNNPQGETNNVNQSRHISVKLQKIQGSTDLLALQSNYSPSETLEDLEDVIFQDEFQTALTEEPQAFDISVDDDGYDIEPCENCLVNPCESLEQILKKGITLYRNLYILHWMAKGNDMMKLHILSEEMYGELIQEIDTTGELLVEKCGTIPQPDWVADYIQVKPYEFQESLDILKKFIQEYIDCIDYAYPNQTSDVQSTLDEWLRYWNKQINYFIKNQEE